MVHTVGGVGVCVGVCISLTVNKTTMYLYVDLSHDNIFN